MLHRWVSSKYARKLAAELHRELYSNRDIAPERSCPLMLPDAIRLSPEFFGSKDWSPRIVTHLAATFIFMARPRSEISASPPAMVASGCAQRMSSFSTTL